MSCHHIWSPIMRSLPSNDSQRKWTNRFNSVTESITLEKTSTEVTEEARTLHQRTEAPHTQTWVSLRHGGRDSAIIESDCKENKKTNSMQSLLRLYRNCTAIHRLKPLKKWQKLRRHFAKSLRRTLWSLLLYLPARRACRYDNAKRMPPYTDSDTEDQNLFTGEFMPEVV